MTKRFAHIRNLVFLREKIALFPEKSDALLKIAIVASLPSQYRKIYDWIGTCYHPVTSGAVMRAWELKPNHASTILNELWQFGLLTRAEYTDAHGKGFRYEIAP